MEKEEQQLKNEIADLEALITPKRNRLQEIWATRSAGVKVRIKKAMQGKGDFAVPELVFAATARCKGCGAGYAYPKDIDPWGSWYCSAILLGRAAPGSEHEPSMPFSIYEVKSENQPSADGRSTRPDV